MISLDTLAMIILALILILAFAWLGFSDKIVKVFGLDDEENPSWTFSSNKN